MERAEAAEFRQDAAEDLEMAADAAAELPENQHEHVIGMMTAHEQLMFDPNADEERIRISWNRLRDEISHLLKKAGKKGPTLH